MEKKNASRSLYSEAGVTAIELECVLQRGHAYHGSISSLFPAGYKLVT